MYKKKKKEKKTHLESAYKNDTQKRIHHNILSLSETAQSTGLVFINYGVEINIPGEHFRDIQPLHLLCCKSRKKKNREEDQQNSKSLFFFHMTNTDRPVTSVPKVTDNSARQT